MLRNPPISGHKPKGSALVFMLIMLGVFATLLVGALGKANRQIERDKITSAALAQAKEALIGYAASVALTLGGTKRPGDLPCPDINDDGFEEIGCGNAAGTTFQNFRLGRLPWKSLGLPDLRDGNGERLWYAVSNNFKKNTRTICTSTGMPGCLNSDMPGTITVRDSSGNVIFDATGTTGAIAVIFAPGAPLTRQDGVVQNRTCAPCNAQEVCTAAPATNTPRCNPINYLDIAFGEDNADFRDSNANGFIQGPINAADATILNDRLLTITPGDLMPVLEKRVAREALTCLTDYAADPQNQNRYPWAAPLNPLAPPSYDGVTDSRFGRMPNTGVAGFASTVASSGAVMKDHWALSCKIDSISGWWLNWKEIVFYAVADAYKPVDLSAPPLAPVCGTCLTVNPPSALVNKQVVVFVAGRRLAGVAGGQPRTTNSDKGTIANYLENQNSTTADDVFERNTISPTFNDATSFAPEAP
jgi:hypothetical protein